jgi:hypothetical protein
MGSEVDYGKERDINAAFMRGTLAGAEASNKWWISKLNEEHSLIRLTAEQDEFATGYYVAMPEERWNLLLEELEGK